MFAANKAFIRVTSRCRECGETFEHFTIPTKGEDTPDTDKIREVDRCFKCLMLEASKLMSEARVDTARRPDEEPSYYGLHERNLFPFGVPDPLAE